MKKIKRGAATRLRAVTLTLGHLAELMKAYFTHRKRLVQQLRLRFVEEEEPTRTAGSLSLNSNPLPLLSVLPAWAAIAASVVPPTARP